MAENEEIGKSLCQPIRKNIAGDKSGKNKEIKRAYFFVGKNMRVQLLSGSRC